MVISVESVSKRYRLGVINRGMLYRDLQSWWARLRKKEDPNSSLGGHPHRIEHGDEFWALRDVSFTVKQGETLGIIGRNGAGKSTLLKVLSSITSPTEGSIRMKGRVASLLEVGTGFHPELTGRENIFLNGAILGMNRAEVRAKFDQIVEFSALSEFIDTPVKRYSSGMYVRLAFSVAAHLEPEILIVDEVLAVGDAEFQRKCLGRMGEVTREGRTVLFVSHNMAAVQSLCSRGIVLHDGQLGFDGTARQAVDEYLKRNSATAENFYETKNRLGSGDFRIENIYFTNAAGERRSEAISGEPLEIHFCYRNHSGRRFPGLHLALSVRTPDQTAVFSQRNSVKGIHFRDLTDEGEIVLRIPKLPLPSGSYELHYGVKSEISNGERLDGTVVGFGFEVREGDFFGSGTSLGAESGLCLVDGDWRFEKQHSV